MYLSRQKHKTQKISVFIFGLLLLILEGLRIFWRYKYLQFNKLDMSFYNVVDLNFFTLSLWVTIPLVLIASFRKQKKKTVRGLDFVFSIASIIAIINLVYPQGLNTNFEFYHCYNLIYALSRSLVIMLGIMFAVSKWISVSKFLDHWKGLLSLLVFGIICIALGFILGTQHNLFYIEFCPVFDNIGIHLSFPWHLLMLGCFFFVFQIIFYLPFRIISHFKNK
jgi:predicted tellurium resistance membrane protein TerC